METYNFPHVVPQLVEDNSLKRARTTVIDEGQEKEVIQVTPIGAPTVDAQTIADAMGKAPTSTTSNSVCDRLEVLGTKSDAAVSGTQSGSINGRIRNLELTSASMYQYLINIANYIGSFTSSAWSGTGDGTLNEVAKRTSIATGTQSDPSWSGIGDGSVIAIEKATYESVHGMEVPIWDTATNSSNIQTRIGNKNDSAWGGSGDGTVIALLKGIYNKL